MDTEQTQAHIHGDGCGHTRIRHHDHIDFLENGHLYGVKQGKTEDHVIDVTDENPDVCKPITCNEVEKHQANHEIVPHGDHVDYLVNGRLHHIHGDHCDDHGPLLLA